jgi:hypothetical protein
MKPNPFLALYHFTVPVSWTLASEAGRSEGDLKLARGGLDGAAVLLSTLIISVTCGPRCPEPLERLARLHGADADASEHRRM